MGTDQVLLPLDVSCCTPEQKAKILELAADTRKFEIERFWQRSLFFWGFITAALVAYGASRLDDQLRTIAGCYGFLCSVAWSLQNRGSKYWHESWEKKAEVVQQEVLGTNLFSNKEPIKRQGWFEAKRYSSSKLAMALSDITCVAWLGLIYFPLTLRADSPFDPIKVTSLIITAGATAYLVYGTKSKT